MNSSSTNIILSSDREIKPVFSLISLANEIEGVIEIAPDWFGSSLGLELSSNTRVGGLIIWNLAGFSQLLKTLKAFGFGTNFGWVWVNKDTFLENYIWSNEKGNWLFWDNTTNGFFDYGSNQWMLW